jgi:high affinity sulfate transporter 1
MNAPKPHQRADVPEPTPDAVDDVAASEAQPGEPEGAETTAGTGKIAGTGQIESTEGTETTEGTESTEGTDGTRQRAVPITRRMEVAYEMTSHDYHVPAAVKERVGVFRPPILDWVRGYSTRRLRADAIAGAAVAALAIPQSLGYATVAGVPVQVGLYTLIPAFLAYAVMGSSRVLVIGPVSTVAVLTGSIVAGMAHGDPVRAQLLTASLALVAGLALILLGLLRVGWVAEFLSAPIVTGFVSGLVVLVVLGELPALLGLPVPTGSVLDRAAALAQEAGDAHLGTLALSVGALTVLFAGRRFAPRVPWALLVLVGAILMSRLTHLSTHGIRVVGTVPTGLPHPALPVISLADAQNLVTGGLAVAMVGLAEGLAAARLFGARLRERIDANQELVANGFADLAAGLLNGMPVAGSLSKTAVADRAGARTQITGVVAGVLSLAALLAFAGLLRDLPRGVLSAIVVTAVIGLIDVPAYLRYRRVRRNDLISSQVALLGVLLLGPLNGLLLAIGQSLLGLVYRSVQVHVDRMGKVPGEKAAWGSVRGHPERTTPEGVLVLRLDGPLFWPNAEAVYERLLAAVARRPGVRALVLDLEATNQLDTTSADVLQRLLTTLRDQNVDLYLVRVFAKCREVLENSGLLGELGPEHVWHSIAAGVKAARHAPPLVTVAVDAAEESEAVLTEDEDDDAGEGAERIVARPDNGHNSEDDEDHPHLFRWPIRQRREPGVRDRRGRRRDEQPTA